MTTPLKQHAHRLACTAALVLASLGSAMAGTRQDLGAGVPDWTTFQGNPAHTGYVPATLDPATFQKLWQIPIKTVPGQGPVGAASIAVSNGLVYVSGGLQLNAYRETDGQPVWSHDFSNLTFPSVNPPAVANGVVYVAAGQQSATALFAFDAATGTEVFKQPMSSQWEHHLAPTPGPRGVYTNAGAYGGLYGFKRTGKPLFFARQDQQSEWTPAVDDSGVYAYTGFLQVLDPVTGAVTHQIADDSFENYVYAIGGSPVLGAPGSVFVANYANAQLNGGGIGNTLLAFSTTTDSVAWQATGAYPTTPGYRAGQLYAVNNGPLRLEVRAEADGAIAWTWTPPSQDTQFVSEVLITRNLVFVSTNTATYAISLKSHKRVWTQRLSGKLALSKAGQLYIQQNNTLTAFKVF